MSEKPRWEKWKGEKRVEYEKRLQEWENGKKADKMTMGKCYGCQLWERPFDGDMGSCHRYPEPVTTKNTHWCGEFK